MRITAESTESDNRHARFGPLSLIEGVDQLNHTQYKEVPTELHWSSSIRSEQQCSGDQV